MGSSMWGPSDHRLDLLQPCVKWIFPPSSTLYQAFWSLLKTMSKLNDTKSPLLLAQMGLLVHTRLARVCVCLLVCVCLWGSSRSRLYYQIIIDISHSIYQLCKAYVEIFFRTVTIPSWWPVVGFANHLKVLAFEHCRAIVAKPLLNPSFARLFNTSGKCSQMLPYNTHLWIKHLVW